MELKDIKIGAPLIFNSGIYGRTAVHVTAVYNEVIHFSIDGGEASRQVRDFPELSDGMYFAIASRMEKRPSLKPARPGKNPVQVLAEQAGIIKNTIREVPGVGKVAIITDDPLKPATGGILKLETLTLSQLKDHAKHIGMSTGTKLSRKADIIAAIKQFESSKVETF